MCRLRILSLVGVLAVAGLVCGDGREDKDLRDDPLLNVADARELAQARVNLGDVKDLARAKVADARFSANGRFKNFIAGLGTLEFLIESLYRVLDSEMALASTDTERIAAHERLWVFAHVAETMNENRFLHGRIPIQDFMPSVLFCRDAEIRLALARQKDGKKLPLAGDSRGLDPEDLKFISLDMRELAEKKLQGVNTPIEALRKAKREAARRELSQRFGNFCAGRGTLDFLLRSLLRFLDAERAIAGDTPASQAAYYEAYWLYTREIDRIDTARYHAGRIPVQDYMQSRYFLLDAQIGLLQTPAKEEKGTHRALMVLGINDELARYDPDFFKDLSTEREAVRSANLNELLQERKEAARKEYVGRAKEFLVGRGTLDFLHEVTLHLRDAELTIAKQEAERRVILERHWARCKSIEAINKQRNDEGRIPTKDYLESRWYRLDAEIDLIRALAKK
jgi:hypothetical protein